MWHYRKKLQTLLLSVKKFMFERNFYIQKALKIFLYYIIMLGCKNIHLSNFHFKNASWKIPVLRLKKKCDLNFFMLKFINSELFKREFKLNYGCHKLWKGVLGDILKKIFNGGLCFYYFLNLIILHIFLLITRTFKFLEYF